MNTRYLGATALLAALVSTGCITSPGYGGGYNGGYGGGYGSGAGQGASCYDCGTVSRIVQGTGNRMPNATGAVVGGLLGAVAGRKLARDKTDSKGRQNAATIGGAAAGAAIGNAIQNRAGTGYDIYVRMQDGRELVVSQDDLGGIREGSYVEVRNGRAHLR